MRQRILKKAVSALCLALALCIAAYPAALAQETVESNTSVTAAETTSAEADSSSASAEDNSKTEEVAEDAASDANPAVSTGSDSGAPSVNTSGTEQTSEPSTSDVSTQDETTVITAESVSGGWTLTDEGWTFLYWESEKASEAIQAADMVLYLTETMTAEETTFAAGYYYFNEAGVLTLTGVGFVTALSVESEKSLPAESAESSGKLVTVTTTQSGNNYSSTVVFYTGSYDGVYYSNGTLYTGFYFDPDTEALFYITDGVAVEYTGKYETSNTDTYGDTTLTGDGLWYYNGSKFTGYVRRTASDYVWYVTDGVGGTKLTGKMTTDTAYVQMDTGEGGTGDGLWYYNGSKFTGYVRRTASDYVWAVTDGVGGTKLTGKMDTGTDYVQMDTATKGTGDGLWYYNGSKFTGYVRRSSSDYLWVVTSGVGGTKLTGIASTSKYYVRMDTGTRSKGDGKCYSKGVLYTGGYNGYYYKNGVKQTGLSGWKTFNSSGNTSSKSSDNTYYFSSGKYVTGWQTLTRNGSKYRFYFNSDGTLCKNIYKVFSAYKKKSTQLVVNRGVQTATLYAQYNGSYMLPCKSFVVSTAKLDSNYHVGTYKITKRMAWFPYGSWYYKWACYLSGSGAWTHSEQYYTKGNHYSLNVSSYNNLGTKQSKLCVRMQVVNCKLIYDMAGSGYIKQVVLTKSSNAGPFGKMTVTDNVDKSGKLSGSKSYDPTDPAVT